MCYLFTTYLACGHDRSNHFFRPLPQTTACLCKTFYRVAPNPSMCPDCDKHVKLLRGQTVPQDPLTPENRARAKVWREYVDNQVKIKEAKQLLHDCRQFGVNVIKGVNLYNVGQNIKHVNTVLNAFHKPQLPTLAAGGAMASNNSGPASVHSGQTNLSNGLCESSHVPQPGETFIEHIVSEVADDAKSGGEMDRLMKAFIIGTHGNTWKGGFYEHESSWLILTKCVPEGYWDSFNPMASNCNPSKSSRVAGIQRCNTYVPTMSMMGSQMPDIMTGPAGKPNFDVKLVPDAMTTGLGSNGFSTLSTIPDTQSILVNLTSVGGVGNASMLPPLPQPTALPDLPAGIPSPAPFGPFAIPPIGRVPSTTLAFGPSSARPIGLPHPLYKTTSAPVVGSMFRSGSRMSGRALNMAPFAFKSSARGRRGAATKSHRFSTPSEWSDFRPGFGFVPRLKGYGNSISNVLMDTENKENVFNNNMGDKLAANTNTSGKGSLENLAAATAAVSKSNKSCPSLPGTAPISVPTMDSTLPRTVAAPTCSRRNSRRTKKLSAISTAVTVGSGS
ncbi:hypothetical protein ABW19_dt0201643 [Dactylella cylindrospora]|nr:hypothetical protein ABW19_dt0201643 [Dactylella cylindrospora]